MPNEEYEHGIRSDTEDTEVTAAPTVTPIAQIVIGTAPIHRLDTPAAAVNKPIICYNMDECKAKLGYSEDFEKYTLCQSMYATYKIFSAAPIVFINVLNPATHYTAVAAKAYPVNNNAIAIDDDVIVSTLEIKSGEETIPAAKYETEWVNGVLTVNFTESVTGSVTVAYNKIDPSKVTKNDIIGSWDTSTDARTGAELIRLVNPTFGVIPAIIIAPGWTTDDTVGAVLASKVKGINGCYDAYTLLDLECSTTRTRAAAITAKGNRTFNEKCIFTFPLVEVGGKKIAYSAVIAALIMAQAAANDGVTCKSPSNQPLDIDNVVLADGTPVCYDEPAGNELNGAGIVTVISRNGWYSWGNNTAAFPGTKDPVKRWIMTGLQFAWIGNDFVNTNHDILDEGVDPKIVENAVSDYNLKLAAFSTDGRIIRGKVTYNESDNTEDTLMEGKFVVRTSIGGKTPMEAIKNIQSYDKAALSEALFGGEQ